MKRILAISNWDWQSVAMLAILGLAQAVSGPDKVLQKAPR